jgi:hypothetical protein
VGVAEEGGKAVGSYISALGTQPVLLVQSAIIAGVVFILYAQGSKAFVERQELLQSIFESQKNVREILSQCIVPQRSGMPKPPFKLQDDTSTVVKLPPITPLPTE